MDAKERKVLEAHTKALNENTAVLRELLKMGKRQSRQEAADEATEEKPLTPQERLEWAARGLVRDPIMDGIRQGRTPDGSGIVGLLTGQRPSPVDERHWRSSDPATTPDDPYPGTYTEPG